MGGERFPSLLPVLLFLGSFVAHVSHGSVETAPCRQVQEFILQNPHPRSGEKSSSFDTFANYSLANAWWLGGGAWTKMSRIEASIR